MTNTIDEESKSAVISGGCPRRIVSAMPSGYVTQRSKIASAGGWERTLSGQSGTGAGRDGEINARRLKGEVEGLLSRKYSDGDRFP